MVLAVVLSVAVCQWLGLGLIVTDHPPTPPEAAAQGITYGERTSFHFVVFPLTIVGIAGLILAMIPQRDPPNER